MFGMKAFMKLEKPITHFAFKLSAFLTIIVVDILMRCSAIGTLDLFGNTVFRVSYLYGL